MTTVTLVRVRTPSDGVERAGISNQHYGHQRLDHVASGCRFTVPDQFSRHPLKIQRVPNVTRTMFGSILNEFEYKSESSSDSGNGASWMVSQKARSRKPGIRGTRWSGGEIGRGAQ